MSVEGNPGRTMPTYRDWDNRASELLVEWDTSMTLEVTQRHTQSLIDLLCEVRDEARKMYWATDAVKEIIYNELLLADENMSAATTKKLAEAFDLLAQLDGE